MRELGQEPGFSLADLADEVAPPRDLRGAS
jgi:hypothetical protein